MSRCRWGQVLQYDNTKIHDEIVGLQNLTP